MMLFRLHDMMSVLFWRLMAPFFGGVGRRVRIVRPRYLQNTRHIRIGDDVVVQEGAYIAVQPDAASIAGLAIGAGTMVGHRVHIVVTHNVMIGDAVLIADNVFMADCSHRYADPKVPILLQGLERRGPVHIGDGSWIGENAAIIGARIGRNCVIGAHSIVTRDVPDWTVVAGQPAVCVKRFCPQRRTWLRTKADGSFTDDAVFGTTA